MRSWKPTGRRRANSGTRRIASGRGFSTSYPIARLPSGQFASTCTTGRSRWDCWCARPVFRRVMPGAWKRRLIGTKPTPIWRANESSCRCLRCAAWRVERPFHCAYLHATQQAFLEAHELAFAYFGGVFRKLRYDNLTSAVKKILRGSRREETARFVAFRSHWRFEAEFCTPAEPHEKGGIEGEAGYFRRNHWVPVPEAVDVAALNRQLLVACQQDEHRLIAGHVQTVGSGLLIEREHLLPLAEEGIDLAQTSFPTVNGLGCAKVLTNTYSVPLPAGTQVQAKAYASIVELWHDGRCVARHERCYRRQQQILDLEHYLDVLYRKPGALAGSKPLEQRRQAGLWPPSFDRIWEALIERHGKQSGTRQMIDLLKLSQKHGHLKLKEAIESALAGSCYDAAAVRHLLNADELRHASCEAIDVGALERYARPLPVMHEYDQLLTAGGAR